MSFDGWRTALVLGGIRSGKSAFAESLVAGAAVRYVATSIRDEADPDFLARIEAHRARRPAGWTTSELGSTPERLAALIAEAKPDETVLVDDLGGWVTAQLPSGAAVASPVAELVAAVHDTAGRVVIVSPEVGLSVVPATELGRSFADRVGAANQVLAAACDAVVLVVAGQPTWLKRPAVVGRAAVVYPATPGGPKLPDAARTDMAQPGTAQTGTAQTGTAQPGAAQTDAAMAGTAQPGAATAGAAMAGTAQLDMSQPAAMAGTAQPGAATAGAAQTGAATAGAAQTGAAMAGLMVGSAIPGPPDLTVGGTIPAPPGIEVRQPPAWPTQAPRDAGVADPWVDTPGPEIGPGIEVPLPDEEAAAAAAERLARLDVPGQGLGALEGVVRFAAATQGNATPRPWRAVRVLLVHGDHDGASAAGESASDAARRAREAAAGEGALGALIAEVGAGLRVVEAPPARPIETEDALGADEVAAAMRYGWRLAEDAVDSGIDAIVVGACGAGSGTAAAAVTAAITGTEAVALLGLVPVPGGRYDDLAWMVRCAAVRDALHRTRDRPRRTHDVLASLGGGDLAIATGIVLGAASRRTAVLLDGPVGVAAALIARDLAGQSRLWCLLPDDGGHPAVKYGADMLDLKPVLDLRLGLGEGAGALAALPLLRSALLVAGALNEHPGPPIDAGLSTQEIGDETGVDRPTSLADAAGTADGPDGVDDPGARA